MSNIAPTEDKFVPFTFTQLRRNPDSSRPVRIYADGVYDLFHLGHSEQLRQAKQAFPNVELLVGVVSDEDVVRYKGRPTVLTTEQRRRLVSSCRWVDEVLVDAPFFADLDYINKHKIDLVAHDALPYKCPENEDCYAVFKKVDRFYETRRQPGISTTEILERIFTHEDEYRKKRTTECTTILKRKRTAQEKKTL